MTDDTTTIEIDNVKAMGIYNLLNNQCDSKYADVLAEEIKDQINWD